ncbi:MAG: DegT/DnrJ/EryC1/StrS family aminotransferase, partial [Clostridia bacterium]|nr:DegT/DnrJ/EryC1/StrS family aminotransferase [Clostridia bacterium]
GGAVGDKLACSFGDVSTTSFFPAKPLGCYGDGGAIFTDDDELYALLTSIRIHGKGSMKYDNVRIGLNSRLDTMQAAILLPKLHAFIDYELAARQKWANLYSELLSGKVCTPTLLEGYSSSWAQYTIMLDSAQQRDALQAKLKELGIPTMVYYWRPLHLQTAYTHLGCGEGSLPVSENASSRVLSLPMHPYLDEDTVRVIAQAVIDNI